MHVQRIAAFSQGTSGGNPAGVVLCEALPPADRMLAIAAEVGYSETVFAAPCDDGWRVRYFAPEIEVPFCGHATIALGAALALAHGDGTFALQLNDTRIAVTGWRNPALMAALQSPRTRSEQAPKQLVETALGLFSYALRRSRPTSASGNHRGRCPASCPGSDEPREAGRDAL